MMVRTFRFPNIYGGKSGGSGKLRALFENGETVDKALKSRG